MASRGHSYDFVDTIPKNLYCKKCSFVARRLTVTSCCGVHYCHTCITEIQHKGDACLECGEKSFGFFIVRKHSEHISRLNVYCKLRDMGCDWCGGMAELKSHLDPDLNNCQYLDTRCPLKCEKMVPRNQLEDHMANDCTKRQHFCQHCNYKSTYEEVVNTHLPKCPYVPLQCPNMCGVTCERETMEDHKKICRLQKESCAFSQVGCKEEVPREDSETHLQENMQDHLLLTATAAVQGNQGLREEMKRLEEKFQNNLEDLPFELDEKLEESEVKMGGDIWLLKKQIQKLETDFQDYKSESDSKVEQLKNKIEEQDILIKSFHEFQAEFVAEMHQVLDRNFHFKIPARDKWTSPCMYTHVHGYKFEISIWRHRGEMLWIASIGKGKYNNRLTWPITIKCCVEVSDPERQKRWTASKSFTFVNDNEESLLGNFLCKVADTGSDKQFHLTVSAIVL